MTEKEHKFKKILYLVLPVILALYPLRNIWLGVEMTDGAYSAGNYRILGTMDRMWLFSTYLPTLRGSFSRSCRAGTRLWA